MLHNLPKELLEIIASYLHIQHISSLSHAYPELSWMVNHVPCGIFYILLDLYMASHCDNFNIDRYKQLITTDMLKMSYKPISILDTISFAFSTANKQVIEHFVDHKYLNQLDKDPINQRSLIIKSCGKFIMNSTRYCDNIDILYMLHLLGMTEEDKHLMAAYYQTDCLSYLTIDRLEHLIDNYGIKSKDCNVEVLQHIKNKCDPTKQPWDSPKSIAKYRAVMHKFMH